MQRSILEKASWISGIVSALLALWLFFAPSDKDALHASVQPPAAPKLLPASEVSQPLKTSEGAPPTAVATCPKAEAIEVALKTVQALSTFSQRDAGYKRLLDDALCRADIAIAKRITELMSTFSARDDGYQKIVQRMVAVGDFSGAEKITEKLSTFSARDNARNLIVQGIRKNGS